MSLFGGITTTDRPAERRVLADEALTQVVRSAEAENLRLLVEVEEVTLVALGRLRTPARGRRRRDAEALLNRARGTAQLLAGISKVTGRVARTLVDLDRAVSVGST